MDDPSIALVSLCLLLFAAWFMFSHVRNWRAYQLQNLAPEDLDYRRRQYRRRMQTSAMLGLLAVAMFAWKLLSEWLQSFWFSTVFLLAILLLLCWVGLLALVDVWATNHHFGRLRHRCAIEQAKLEVELRRAQSVRGNGKAGTRGEVGGRKGEG
jgi:UDP-N-acetylmuramyl pentapeptide phosphotransferase/UDP-N-acetylglucosamine-1-phosphate transferase